MPNASTAPLAPLTPATLDSCNVQVTVKQILPAPHTTIPGQVNKGGSWSNYTRHMVPMDVTIGSMVVSGCACVDESQAGVLTLVECIDGHGLQSLPPAVVEVITDLGSASIAFRVREAIEAAVQQYDREAGAMGDGPEHDPLAWGRAAVDFHIKYGIGPRPWKHQYCAQSRRIIRTGNDDNVRPA